MNSSKDYAAVSSGDTTELTKRISSLVMAEEIYQTVSVNNNRVFRELVILISNKCTKALQELVPHLNMVLDKYPGVSYRLYYTHQVQEAVKRGSLIFYLLCNPQNLIYKASSLAALVLSETATASEAITKAKEAYNKEIAKIEAFTDGVKFYWQKENYPQTAFMVQQQIELSFRAIELFAMGKEKTTHSIQAHQKYVSNYLPALSKLFDPEDDRELELLKLTERAYTAVRYEQDYQISKEQCAGMIEKGEGIAGTINGIFQKLLTGLEQVVSESGNGVTAENSLSAVSSEFCKTADNSPEQRIVDLLCNKLQVEAIYCLATCYQTYSRVGYLSGGEINQENLHHDLLVITSAEPANSTYTLTSEINQGKAIEGTVTLFIHSLKVVREGLLASNRFFHQALHSGRLLHLNDQFPGDLVAIEYNNSKDNSQRIHYKRERLRRAENLLNAAGELSEWDDGDVQLVLLHLSMEQLCLGFIHIMLDYIPNPQTLSHLFDICRFITPETDLLLPRSSPTDKELFGRLCDGLKKLRFSVNTSTDPAEIFLLYKNCRSWYKRASEIIDEYLEKEKNDSKLLSAVR